VAMARIRNVFEIIELYGHDENFEPVKTEEFTPTTAPAGSREKIHILAERIQRGMPLWHPEDSTDNPVGELVAAE
jgi:predicted pyridoxine 5'-phosphate oxidase superfamily flavin-nucleotide-binding protein